MATHASAEKRHRQSLKRREANRQGRAEISTEVKKVRQLAASGNKDEAKKQLVVVTRLLDKAAGRNLVHKNNARRRISRLAQLVG
jgi:small subunit ribosomal protein S20